MYNSNEDEFDSNIVNSKTETICKRLRILMYCVIILAIMRMANSQILWMIGDLMSSLMVYCTYSSRGKIMALFCFINAIFSCLYALFIGIENLNHYSKTQSTTKVNTEETKIEYIQSDNYNENNLARSQGISLYPIFVVFMMIWALVVYGLISYNSWQGFKFFQHPMGSFADDTNNNDERRLIMRNRESHYNNYGAANNAQVNSNNWTGQSYRNDGYGLSNTQGNNNNRENKMVPFSGRGIVIGGS
jgi:hypothetical protein